MTYNKNSSNSMRIGIVEVGSLSIRFMVASFEYDGSFTATKTDSHMHGVDINKLDEMKIAELWSEVDRYYESLKRFGCDRVMVYGTELCRRLAGLPAQRVPAFLHVLSPEEEAVASWAAGFMCVHGEHVNNRYTIVDQGAGSTEFISATWTGKTIKNVLFDSLDIGHKKIMDIFYASGTSYGRTIHALLEKYDEKIQRHKSTGRNEIYLIGSVATKLAWINVRKSEADIYQPHLVNDEILNVKEIFNLHAYVMKSFRENPEQARFFIDPRVRVKDEFERVMSGSVFLMMISLKLGYQQVRVSGYGTRHGMAFLVRRGLI